MIHKFMQIRLKHYGFYQQKIHPRKKKKTIWLPMDQPKSPGLSLNNCKMQSFPFTWFSNENF